MIVTKKIFAEQQGVAENTISTWIKRGHLSAPALTADGRINTHEAERQLHQRIDLTRSIGKRLSAQRAAAVPQPTQPRPLSPEFVDVNRAMQGLLAQAACEVLTLAAGWITEALIPALGPQYAAQIVSRWLSFRRGLEELLREPLAPHFAPVSELSYHFELALDEEVLVSVRDWAVDDLVAAIGCDRAVVIGQWRQFWESLEARYVPPGYIDDDPGPRIQGVVIEPGLIRREPSLGLGPEDDLVQYFGLGAGPDLKVRQHVAFSIVRDHSFEHDGGFHAVGIAVIGPA